MVHRSWRSSVPLAKRRERGLVEVTVRAGQGLAVVRAWVSGPRHHTERPRNKARSHRPDRWRTGQACGVRAAEATGHVGTRHGVVRRVVRGTDSVPATIAVDSVLQSPKASTNWASVVFSGHEPLSKQRLHAAVVPAGPMKAGRDGRRSPEDLLSARRASSSGATTHQRMPAGRFLQGATAVLCGSQATSGCRCVEGRPRDPGRLLLGGRVFAIRPAAGAFRCAAGSYRPAPDVGYRRCAWRVLHSTPHCAAAVTNGGSSALWSQGARDRGT